MKKQLLLFLLTLLPLVTKANATGYCGENVSYTYNDATQTLTITGYGKMDDFTNTTQPWYVYNEDIQKIIIEDGVTSIGNFSFTNFNSLSSITIPNSIVSIGRGAFQRCKSIISINIPEGVESIENSAFYGCTNLSIITLPTSLISISAKAFMGCNNLSKVEITDLASWCRISFQGGTANPCTYANSIFLNGKEIINLSIPENVSSICNYAFYGCSNITSVSIPNSVNSIGGSSFADCKNLCSIKIPNSVAIIGDQAFYRCTGLTSIEIPNSITAIGNYAFQGCTALTSIEIPNSLSALNEGLFSGCISLNSVTIPSNVTTIGNYVFQYCYVLKKIFCYAEEVPNADYSFHDMPINEVKLYVPESSISKYKISYPWNGFGEILILSENVGDDENDNWINTNLDCEIKWNGEWSSSTSPWSSIYSRGIDITLTNKFNEDIKIIRIDGFIDINKMSTSIPNSTNIRIVAGDTHKITFSLEESEEPTTLPWLKVYYKVGTNDYIKVVKDSNTTAINEVHYNTYTKLNNIYTLDGRCHNQLQKGINIIYTQDGKIRKVIGK